MSAAPSVPHDPALAHAVLLHQRGEHATAVPAYRALLAAEPRNTVARFNLGTLLLQQGEVAEAAGLLAQALAEDPINPLRGDAVRALALALFRADHREIARPWLDEARLHAPHDAELEGAWRASAVPAWLEPEVFDPGLGETLRRSAPREGRSYIYTIDIVGTCNLRCPSCPVGNWRDAGRATGFIPLPLFRDIVAKIRAESPAETPEVWLFNWGEPLLHPQLPEMLALLREHALPAHLSTNLNIRHRLDEVIAAAPAALKISISGFSPQTYGRTHERGHLDLVVENMRAIRASLDRHGVATHVWVGQHVYRGNQHEVEPLAALCRELGFAHQPIAAFYQPLEKLLRIVDGEPIDEPILDELLEHPASYLRRIAARRDGRYDCELRANQTVINHDGSVALCCTVYDPANQLGVAFTEAPRAEIERRKYAHPTCVRCQHAGLSYAPRRLQA